MLEEYVLGYSWDSHMCLLLRSASICECRRYHTTCEELHIAKLGRIVEDDYKDENKDWWWWE